MARAEQATHFFGDAEKAIGFSQVVKAGNTLYISGVIAVDDSVQVVGPGDMALQVKTVYETLVKILAAQGSSLKDVVKETVFATDLAALSAALPARNAVFEAEDAYFPASTMVQITGLMLPEAMIEVEMIAVV
jgi:enamine deaminase RidA (YjgF/YER057c/UK114 family)